MILITSLSDIRLGLGLLAPCLFSVFKLTLNGRALQLWFLVHHCSLPRILTVVDPSVAEVFVCHR